MYIKTTGAEVGWTTFVAPFTMPMWVCTVAIIILGAFVISVTYYVGAKFNKVEDLPFTFGSVLFISFSAFFQQGRYQTIFIYLKIVYIIIIHHEKTFHQWRRSDY